MLARTIAAAPQGPLRVLAGRYLHSWATIDPETMSGSKPIEAMNLVDGQWVGAKKHRDLIDPLNGEVMGKVPQAEGSELDGFIAGLRRTPKSGVHNPFKNPERYNMYGDVTARMVGEMRKPEVEAYFARLVQRVVPKSWAQASGEVIVTRKFLENFCGDQVRFLAKSFGVAGDHNGQMSHGHRYPYGPVALITPFNFPVEIPALQMMGALYMGNRPFVHVDPRVSIVYEQFLRLLIHCGMPATDVDYMHGPAPSVNRILHEGKPRSTLFTGSQKIAEQLALELKGKVYLEDAGFDWKVLGPDVHDLDYVSWQCDQDAYAAIGQKCSAQSILFTHENWTKAGLLDKLRERAATRNLKDLTAGPVITWTTEKILSHVQAVSSLPGAKVLFGGKPLEGHSIPACYGAVEPTAVFVPLETMMRDDATFELCTTELFGPFQVVTEWKDGQLDVVLDALERMENHLTAAIVSRDSQFIDKVIGNTVNGTTYAGIRARTTGAPQNHWFGPAGDPRGAGIGTPEAIRLVWSCHREVIMDIGPTPAALPAQS
ncbi:unnamed protein product [Pedinophyceae sp. YPF-701]|nr:unnamed protein product [Pedinophyceae sp. YPF-701]